jgi:hypothetical protein
MGLPGQVKVSLDAPEPQEVPFINLILGARRQWHYAVVFHMDKDTVLASDGPQLSIRC